MNAIGKLNCGRAGNEASLVVLHICHLIEKSGLLEIESGIMIQSILLLHMREIMFGQKLPEMMWTVTRWQ